MNKKAKSSKSTLWILAVTLLAAGNVWAEEDIPPIYPLADGILKWLQDLWMQVSGCFC